jgi:hypothetical protein
MPYLDHQEYDWRLHKRDVADRFTPNETQRVTLIVGAYVSVHKNSQMVYLYVYYRCYILAIAILWHIPYLNYVCTSAALNFGERVFTKLEQNISFSLEIVYPFKLLTVALHEVSRIASRIGKVDRVSFTTDVSSLFGGLAR